MECCCDHAVVRNVECKSSARFSLTQRLFAVTLRLGRDFIAIGIGIAIGIATLSLRSAMFNSIDWLAHSHWSRAARCMPANVPAFS